MMSSLKVSGDDGGCQHEYDAQTDKYEDIHKLVLQGIMTAGVLSAKGVKKLFTGACHQLKLNVGEKTTMLYVQKVVQEINEKIKDYDMAIRSASCELSGKKFYLFLLSVEKPVMRFHDNFTKFEVEVFKKLLNIILRKYNTFSVPWYECIHVVNDIDKKATITQGEVFIEKMISLQYLTKYFTLDQEYDITLGIRTIRELDPFLRDIYKDVLKTCALCTMLLLHGYKCQDCPTLIHRPCYLKYIAGSKNCPNIECKANWSCADDMIKRVRNEAEGYGDEEDQPSSSDQNQRLEKRWDEIIPNSVFDDSDTEDDNIMPVLEPQPPAVESESDDD